MRTFVISAFLSSFVLTTQAITEPDVSYEITPEPTDATTLLHVSMTFHGDPDGSTRVQLPRCRYGTPRIWESISTVEAEQARLVAVEDDPSAIDLLHEPDATITLRYTIERVPEQDQGIAYRPSVDPDHFHFFNPQWRARLPERDEELEFSIAYANAPRDWALVTNLGVGHGPHHVSSTDEDLSVFIAGGDYHLAQFRSGETPVAVIAHNGFADPQALVQASQEIIERQGELFGGFGPETFVVALTSREGIRAGTAIDQAFVCLADANTNPTNFDVLIAHEVFHNWLPRTATVDIREHGDGIDEFRFDWFFEGFTEFVARALLLESGRITHEQYVERFNKDLTELAANGQRRASLQSVSDAMEMDSYSQKHERTSYVRGPLIALRWDAELREDRGGSTLDLVQSFINAANASDGSITEQEFFDLLESQGAPARSDYTSYIVYGNVPTPPADVFGPRLHHRADHGECGQSRAQRRSVPTEGNAPRRRAGWPCVRSGASRWDGDRVGQFIVACSCEARTSGASRGRRRERSVVPATGRRGSGRPVCSAR